MRDALARVLASPPFARADRLRQFLAYVVEETLKGRAAEIKETVLALDVFDRPVSFDPRIDSIVRLEARRLRERLATYYETDGKTDPIQIELPKGRYAARFVRRPPAAPGDADARHPVPDGATVTTSDAGRRLGVVAALAVMLVIGVVAILVWRRPGVWPPSTVAILPFENVGGEPELDRFAFGLVEDITMAVAGIPGIRVIARSSAFQYRGRGQDIARVGQALGATHLLEGSVRRQDERIRISAQLIRVADAQHVWAEAFDRHVGNAFDVQEAVAAAVANAVSQALPEAATVPRAARTAPSPDAYELYLEGIALRGERTVDSAARALDRFERAVAADPQYAPAYAAMGGALAAMGFHGNAAVPDALPRAVAAVDTALALDDTVAAAHATRAWIKFFHDWDLDAADREFRRALKLNPSLADTHNLYALMLMAQRRDAEAVSHAQTARDLDPLSYTRSNDVGVVMLGTGHPSEALDHAYRAMHTSPTDRGAHGLAAMALVAQRRYDAAIREFDVALSQGPRYTYLLGGLGYARAMRGDRDLARQLAGEIESASLAGTGSWVHVAYIHLAMGDEASALGALARALEVRDVELLFLDAQHMFAPLRHHPGFLALRARIFP